MPAIAPENVTASAETQLENTGSRTLLVVLLLVVIALGAGIWAWRHARTAQKPKEASEPQAASETARVISVLHLETFVVNLSGKEQPAYLRAGIDLGLEKELKTEGENTKSVSQARDAILEVLSTQPPEQLLTAEGKQQLKLRLLAALRDRAPDLSVREIYFTEFLLQR